MPRPSKEALILVFVKYGAPTGARSRVVMVFRSAFGMMKVTLFARHVTLLLLLAKVQDGPMTNRTLKDLRRMAPRTPVPSMSPEAALHRVP